LWQHRYFSCAVARGRLESILRYVELNPVRAGMVTKPELHPCSSAAAHLSGALELGLGLTLDAGGSPGWRSLLETVDVQG
jgi:putative transposase